jgi:hypothetical protein
MARYDQELLDAAGSLLERRTGQRGRLPGARVRRSVSTAYYALFHFLLDEVTTLIAGTGNDMRVRRRTLARTISHQGLRAALDHIRGAAVNQRYETFFQAGIHGGSIATPAFARGLANAFLDAQKKRESADYDLNEPLSETDARLLRLRVRRVIRNWRAARSPQDRDFKRALAILILLKGKLRQDA